MSIGRQYKLLIKPLMVEVDSKWFSVEKCINNPNKLYIFGDNLQRYGMAGQAIIRRCKNATGLATKISPSMEEEAFFNDKDYKIFINIIDKEIAKIKRVFNNDLREVDTIVFPVDGLGTGLSKLPTVAPQVFKYLCYVLDKEFGIGTDPITFKLFKKRK